MTKPFSLTEKTVLCLIIAGIIAITTIIIQTTYLVITLLAKNTNPLSGVTINLTLLTLMWLLWIPVLRFFKEFLIETIKGEKEA